MVKRQGRRTTAHMLRVVLKALVDNKTINQGLDYRTPADEHIVL